MVAILERSEGEDDYRPLAVPMFCSLSSLVDFLTQSLQRRAFQQLLILGTASDIGWMHAALPVELSRLVAAEVNYPLVHSWFSDAPQLSQLKKAVHQLLV